MLQDVTCRVEDFEKIVTAFVSVRLSLFGCFSFPTRVSPRVGAMVLQSCSRYCVVSVMRVDATLALRWQPVATLVVVHTIILVAS